MTTRDQAIREIDLNLRLLTISEKTLETDDTSRQLITLKTEIEALEIVLDPEEPWLIEWLTKAHLKGGMLSTSARVSFQKEQTDGSAHPFNAKGREHLIERFNAWSQKTVSQLIAYENSDRMAVVVAPWIAELDKFKENPTQTY